MQDKVINILRVVLDNNDITESVTQENCENWDSLRHLNLIIALENEFNVSIEPEEIAKMKSFKKIVEILSILLHIT